MHLRWRILITLVVTVFAVVYTLPSIPQIRDSSLAQFLPKEQVNLGLDLKGGIYLTLGVGVEEALANHLTQTVQGLRAHAEDQGIYLSPPKQAGAGKVDFVLTDGSRKEDIDRLISEKFDNLIASSIPMGENNERVRYTASYTPTAITLYSKEILEQTKLTIESRIDQFGVAEPEIRRQQNDHLKRDRDVSRPTEQRLAADVHRVIDDRGVGLHGKPRHSADNAATQDQVRDRRGFQPHGL